MLNFFGNNSQVIVNGKTYKGNNITISNGDVIIDGILQEPIDGKPRLEISVSGDSKIDITSDEVITIKGNVNGNVESKNNVNCNNIYGNVNAGMNVNSDDINGDAKAGMNINCDDIKGNATANKINR